MEKKSINLPAYANIVIIGGGIIGCSIAYHLGHMGCKDVLLLERDELTSGSTWHAAGLMVTFGSMSETATQMRLYGRDLYSSLEAETGLSTGFTPVGFVEAAGDRDRLHTFQNNYEYRKHRTVESLGKVYKCHYPYQSMETARGAKRSPFYGRLKEQGAYYKDVSGWEGADWFAPDAGEARIEKHSWGRQDWFAYWEAEHKAARENVIIMDMIWIIQMIPMKPD